MGSQKQGLLALKNCHVVANANVCAQLWSTFSVCTIFSGLLRIDQLQGGLRLQLGSTFQTM